MTIRMFGYAVAASGGGGYEVVAASSCRFARDELANDCERESGAAVARFAFDLDLDEASLFPTEAVLAERSS